MTILLADPPLIPLAFAPGVLVRAGLADRPVEAREALPSGVDLRVVEGHRSMSDQRAISGPVEAGVSA
jgi:D-alanyl-D-alanine dipeptidase